MLTISPDSFTIRPENSSDSRKIEEVVKRAFSKNSSTDVEECALVNNLRKSSAFIPFLSLAAELNGKIVGHIMFTKAFVGDETVLCLAPLSVDHSFQNRGVGTALVKEGHRRAKKLGYQYSVILGDPNYYSRFGYKLASELGIGAPAKIPVEFLQAIQLDDNAPRLCGVMTYPKEFGI
ncbi:MAG: N-acetyltransferase [Burkholderiales bacterium]|nr:N-acetyltransferase [Burkholderiales bacterium]